MDESALHSLLFQRRVMHQHTHTLCQVIADCFLLYLVLATVNIELMQNQSKKC